MNKAEIDILSWVRALSFGIARCQVIQHRFHSLRRRRRHFRKDFRVSSHRAFEPFGVLQVQILAKDRLRIFSVHLDKMDCFGIGAHYVCDHTPLAPSDTFACQHCIPMKWDTERTGVQQIAKAELLSFLNKRLRHDCELQKSPRHGSQSRWSVTGSNNYWCPF